MTASVNDNTPRMDGNRLMADSTRYYLIAHVYLAAAGIVFALDGLWVVSVLFFAMFVLLIALGWGHSVAARDAFDYDGARDKLNCKQEGTTSWSA